MIGDWSASEIRVFGEMIHDAMSRVRFERPVEQAERPGVRTAPGTYFIAVEVRPRLQNLSYCLHIAPGSTHDAICICWQRAYEAIVEVVGESRGTIVGYSVDGPVWDRADPNIQPIPDPAQDPDGQLLFFPRSETPKAPSRKTRSHLLSASH